MSDTAQEQPQRQVVAPPLKNTVHTNTPISVSQQDEDGFREMSFITGPTEMETYVLQPDAQGEILKLLAAGVIDEDVKAEVLKILSGGIHIPTGVETRAATAGGTKS